MSALVQWQCSSPHVAASCIVRSWLPVCSNRGQAPDFMVASVDDWPLMSA